MLVSRCVLLLLCSVAVVPSAFAQASSAQVNRDAERLQEREQERLREREEQFRQSQTTPPQATQVAPEAEVATEAGGCAAVRSVQVKGMTRYAQSDFAADLVKLSGDCVSIADITRCFVPSPIAISRMAMSPHVR